MKITKHQTKMYQIFAIFPKIAKKKQKCRILCVMFLTFSQCLLRNQAQDVSSTTTTTTRPRATTNQLPPRNRPHQRVLDQILGLRFRNVVFCRKTIRRGSRNIFPEGFDTCRKRFWKCQSGFWALEKIVKNHPKIDPKMVKIEAAVESSHLIVSKSDKTVLEMPKNDDLDFGPVQMFLRLPRSRTI